MSRGNQVSGTELGSFRVLDHFKESRAEIIWSGLREAALRGYEVIQCSFASPRVTAMLARILSVFPGIHPLHAKSLLRQIAIPTTG